MTCLEDDEAKLTEITALDQQHHEELVEQGNQLVSKVEQLADAVTNTQTPYSNHTSLSRDL